MTSSDFPDFRQGVARLFAGWSKPANDALLESWWEGLKSYPLSAVLDGLRQAQLEAGRFAPGFGEVRRQVQKAQRTAPMTPQVAAAVEAGEWYCATCEDTSWTYEDAPHPRAGQPNGLATMRTDALHTKVVRCSCWPMNPVYKAKRPKPWDRDKGD